MNTHKPEYPFALITALILGFSGAIQAQGSEFNAPILAQNLNSPMQMSIASDGRVFIAEKAGAIRIYNPATGNTTTAGTVSVRDNGEGGMLGIALDPDFNNNNFIYLYYSEGNGNNPNEAVVRYTLNSNGTLNMGSAVVVLRVPDSGQNEHSSGGMVFDGSGNLFIGVGDDSWIGETNGYSPMDERPGREAYDSQKSASNNHDLRGSILRIRPLSDGTYEIPPGNLFPPGHPTGLPEIYIMGCRNPFRQTVDPLTGWLYWGEPGPNARAPSASRGPRGHDEINLAKTPGNYGWPYFVGPNEAYVEYDYATGVSGQPFNPAAPVNNSPNNTGDQNLPSAQPAMVWYSYDPFPAWPIVTSNSTTSAISGPFYRFDGQLNSNIKLSAKFDGSLFIFDWSRSHIKYIKVNSQGLPDSILTLAENSRLLLPGNQDNAITGPMDMKVGPDGALYVLAWGNGGYPNNNGAGRLLRLEYIGPRVPVADRGGYHRNPLTKGRRFVNLRSGSLPGIPEGVGALRLYNLAGELVWTGQSASAESLPHTLSGDIPEGVYYLSFGPLTE